MNEHDRLLSFGGQPFTFIQNNPETGEAEEAVAWNFGLMAITTEGEQNRETRPYLYDALPQAQGAWQGQTVNHHEAVRRVLGRNLPAHLQPRGTCFPAGTEVLMADNTLIPIESVAADDWVISHTGKCRRVLKTMQRNYTGYMYRVHVAGRSDPLEMTSEHPVLVTDNVQRECDKGFRPGLRSWVPAKRLNIGDRVLIPYGPDLSYEHVYDLAEHVGKMADRPGTTGAGLQVTDTHVRTFQGKMRVKRHIPLDDRLGRLFGLYIAEGSNDLAKKIVFTFASDEEAYAAETVELLRIVFGVSSKIRRPKKTVIQVVCNSAVLARFFRKECGANSYCICVPKAVFSASKLVRLSVLRGWSCGDGDVKRKGLKLQLRVVSASTRLMKDMRRLSLSCQLHASVIKRKKMSHQRVASNDMYLTGSDVAVLFPEQSSKGFGDGRGRMSYRTKDGFLSPVRKIEKVYVESLPVYNLEVEEEHSYVAENIAVHNCGGRAGSRSAELLQLVKIASGINAEYKDVSHAWAYFLARRKYNMLRGGDGVAGGSIPEALEEGGYLTREESGDLAFAGRGSDDLAVKWGGGGLRGDELERFLALAKDNLLVKRVRVRSAQELADGIAIGGVGICSDGQGYTTQRDSRGICTPRGTWWHYHTRSGVRRITQGVDIFQYDQSWGEDEPGGPLLEGCPGNVFGVEWAVQDRLCRSGEVDVLFDMQLWMSDKLTPDLPWVF